MEFVTLPRVYSIGKAAATVMTCAVAKFRRAARPRCLCSENALSHFGPLHVVMCDSRDRYNLAAHQKVDRVTKKSTSTPDGIALAPLLCDGSFWFIPKGGDGSPARPGATGRRLRCVEGRGGKDWDGGAEPWRSVCLCFFLLFNPYPGCCGTARSGKFRQQLRSARPGRGRRSLSHYPPGLR